MLLVYFFPPHSLAATSDEAATTLSKIEGKTVSSDAFRRRKSDTFKKLRKLGQRLMELAPAEKIQLAIDSDEFTRKDFFFLNELLLEFASQL